VAGAERDSKTVITGYNLPYAKGRRVLRIEYCPATARRGDCCGAGSSPRSVAFSHSRAGNTHRTTYTRYRAPQVTVSRLPYRFGSSACSDSCQQIFVHLSNPNRSL
jgi:hypothetical protein